MGPKSRFVSVNYKENPSLLTGFGLLDEISGRISSFTPRRVDKPVILYGAGNLGKLAKEYLAVLGIPVLCVVDRNPQIYENDSDWAGVSVCGTEKISIAEKKKSLLAVCVATESFSKVTLPLREQGWNDIVPFYDIAEAYHAQYPLRNGWHTAELDDQDLQKIKLVMSVWEDSVSLAHYIQFLAWRALREEWIFEKSPITTHDRYFIPECNQLIHKNEVFVDVGAHHGQVMKTFCEITKGEFNSIHAFEPDCLNLFELKRTVSSCDLLKESDINIYDFPLGSRNEAGLFHGGLGYVSQRSFSQGDTARIQTLDELSIPASFLKIHVEGWEGDVLEGGLTMISQFRPIMTITSYHTRDGLWRLPLQVFESVTDYVFYFRLHSWHGTGAVIYAIPAERIVASEM